MSGHTLTKLQAEMLRAVVEGRVEWRDPNPNLATRVGWSFPRWHIDGREAEYAQGPTLDRLVERGFIASPDENGIARTT